MAPRGCVALVAAVAGLATSRRRPFIGLALVSAAPLLAAALGWDPITVWNIAVVTVLSLTVRGSSAVLAGLVAGVANFAAVILAEPSEPTLPIASVAGVAALGAAAIGSAVRSSRRYRQELHLRAEEAIRSGRRRPTVAFPRSGCASPVTCTMSSATRSPSSACISASRKSRCLRTRPTHTRRSVKHGRGSRLSCGKPSRFCGSCAWTGIKPIGSRSPTRRASGLSSTPSPALGMPVHATLSPLGPSLDPAVGTAAYRIVQEALTNAHRHGSGPVQLTVAPADHGLRIEVLNAVAAPDVRRGDERRQGYGLVGMRERAASTGGSLRVEQTETAFRVVAVLRGMEAE